MMQTSASVMRTIGASNRPSLAANFITATARGDKSKTNIINFNCHVWHRRTWLSTRELERLRQSSRRLTSEHRANQRRHVSQFSSFTGDQPKTLTTDSFLDSSESEPLERFRKTLEPSSLPLKPDFDETLETSLRDVEEVLPLLPENELIELLRAFADKLDEILYPPRGDASRIRIWGKRLEELCRLLPSPPSEQLPKQALIIRAQAMMGMFFPAIDYVNSIENWDVHNLHAAGTVILAVACHRDLFLSLQLILIETPRLSSSADPHIDHIIQILLSRTPIVSSVISRAVQENWPIEKIKKLGYLLLSNKRDPNVLSGIVRELEANNVGVSLSLNQLPQKTESLLLTNDITTAEKLYDCQYIHTGIYLAAGAGNSKHAQTLFDKLKARGEIDKRDIKNLLFSYAEEGNLREVYRVFDECFPKNDEGRRLNEPDVHHYSVAILANARVGDFDAVITWLKDMKRSGLRFNNFYAFPTVIRALSKTNNLEDVLVVFYKMRKLGMKSNIHVYTILLQLHADGKDSEGAESLFKLACKDGIIPDIRMTQLLMDALAASGSLEFGAVRVINYLTTTSRYLPISVYNVLLKMHVSMGAPFDVVFRLFSKLKTMQLVNKDTYSLLVNSACESGRPRMATNIYYEMVKEEQANPTVSLGSAHVLSMIMSAFLRQDNKVQAKEISDHMIKRGIQPSGLTYEELVRSYVKEGTPESLRSAEEFIKSLVSDPKVDRNWDKDESKRNPVDLYSYLLKFYGLQRNVDECERLYGDYLRAGGLHTVSMLSYVLMAYRSCRKSNS